MNRRKFVRLGGAITSAIMLSPYNRILAKPPGFPTVRVGESKRNFKSKAVEDLIVDVQRNIGNREIAWLFGNCFPNTLDTTVYYSSKNGIPDTYVITGDIDAMWLRDSTAQVWPYLPLCAGDTELKHLIQGVINRQVTCILRDPYANAFYKSPEKRGAWRNDDTDMKPGIHERKWEIDSLCYPIRLAFGYYKATGDTTPFNGDWHKAMALILKVLQEQQRKNGLGSYKFMRNTEWATDSLPLGGYGYPVKPCGMVCSMFRPSDDATIFPFLVPSNLFAINSLKKLASLGSTLGSPFVATCNTLATEINEAINKHAIVKTEQFGDIYAYEVNGYGSRNLMDDANVPSLLSLPYLITDIDSDLYANTRRFVLSDANPFFFSGKAGEGVGGPHAGMDMIWPLSIIIRGITSNSDEEIKLCISMLQRSHAGTGFMHEAFHKDDASNFTRSWFAWANTLFGEFIWKVYRERKHLLD